MLTRFLLACGFCVGLLLGVPTARADVGDPQIRTDHVWYPGELACSTFERLFATQADLYERVVGVRPTTDEQKALASWLWRNTHYWHGEEGAEDFWGQGFTKVTYDWADDAGPHQASHTFPGVTATKVDAWSVPTGKNVRTRWVQLEPAAGQ